MPNRFGSSERSGAGNVIPFRSPERLPSQTPLSGNSQKRCQTYKAKHEGGGFGKAVRLQCANVERLEVNIVKALRDLALTKVH